MESGGKAVTKRYRKKITVVLSLVLPVILLFAILNCFTTYVFYEDNHREQLSSSRRCSGTHEFTEESSSDAAPVALLEPNNSIPTIIQ